MLIKGLLACHAKIPLPALYLETGQVPVRYILACRRILYLQTILHRSDEELIKRVYLAQRADTTDGDFCQLVDDDMRLLDLQLTDIQIGSISSFDLKKLVKVKARQASFKYLMDIKETKTKMDNISYMNSFLPQSYLLSMTREQSSLMVALRTRTLRGIRSDLGNMYVDKQCLLPGCQEPTCWFAQFSSQLYLLGRLRYNTAMCSPPARRNRTQLFSCSVSWSRQGKDYWRKHSALLQVKS